MGDVVHISQAFTTKRYKERTGKSKWCSPDEVRKNCEYHKRQSNRHAKMAYHIQYKPSDNKETV